MKHVILWMGIIMLCAGCVSIRNTFSSVTPNFDVVPEDDLRQVASRIEEAVLKGERNPEIATPPSITIDTPEVQQAIRARAARTELLQEFRSTGHIWERRDGLVWIIRSKDYAKSRSRRDKDRETLLINNENQNRWTLYEGLIKANNWSSKALPAVQVIFQEERLPYLESGNVYETEAGERAVVGR